FPTSPDFRVVSDRRPRSGAFSGIRDLTLPRAMTRGVTLSPRFSIEGDGAGLTTMTRLLPGLRLPDVNRRHSAPYAAAACQPVPWLRASRSTNASPPRTSQESWAGVNNRRPTQTETSFASSTVTRSVPGDPAPVVPLIIAP